MISDKGRCGWIALFGPPNAGKSTLLNALIGQKVTIVTPKAQTTRNQIVGILTEKNVQAIFMDTPGLTQVRGQLNKMMMRAIRESLRQADVLMPVIDANLYIRHGELLERDLAPIADALTGEQRPVIIVLNKVDLFADKARLLPLLHRLQEMWPTAELFPLSALLKDGLQDLRKVLAQTLPAGAIQFPAEQISTSSVRFMAAEIIREKLFLNLRQEVPYGVAVHIERWQEDTQSGHTHINAVIFVAKALHKGMVIGKGGTAVKKIGTEARLDIETLLETKVYLELWVKVRERWTEDPAFLQELGLLAESV